MNPYWARFQMMCGLTVELYNPPAPRVILLHPPTTSHASVALPAKAGDVAAATATRAFVKREWYHSVPQMSTLNDHAPAAPPATDSGL